MAVIAPEPQQNLRLVGHESAQDMFRHAAATRLHHAWLLHGPDGIGKTTFAVHYAHFLLSGAAGDAGVPGAAERHAKLILSGAHPDLLMVGRPADEKTGALKEEIPVDSVRAITDFFRLTPAMGGWRIAIVQDTERLGRSAANALLKILEEPPSRSLVFLTSVARGRLLPTLRSRCRALAFAPLTPLQLQNVLRPHLADLPPGDVDMLLRLAAGSPGRAVRILEHDGLQIYRDLLSLLQNSGPEQQSALIKFSQNIGAKGDSDRFALTTQFCEDWLARLCHLVATGEVTEIAGGEGQLLRRMAAIRPLANWFEVVDNCKKQFAAALYASLDRKLVLMQWLQQFVAAR